MSEGLAQGSHVDSNLRPYGHKAPNLKLSHHTPQLGL